MKPPRSNVRFTKQELSQRNVARQVLDDATKSLWEQSRARGVLKRTLAAARDRAYARDDKVAVGGDDNPKASGLRYPEKPECAAARERFLKAVADGRARNYSQTATPAVAAPETAPQAIVKLPADTTICPSCLIERANCSCSRTPPNIVAIGDTLNRIAARLPKPDALEA